MFLSARTFNFRNLKNCEVSTAAKNIYLIGENGQGKSNFLEMIYTLCFGSSFRTKQEKLIIAHGTDELMCQGKFLDKNRLENSISYKIKNGIKEIKQNEKIINDRKDLIENVPCITYKHEDIYFVNGTPEKRRLFFNQTMGIYNINFVETIREYNKIMKMRNVLLKERKIDYISIYNKQLAEKGLIIQKEREKAVKEFSPVFSEVYQQVTGSDVEIKLKYLSSWKESELDSIIRLLDNNLDKDIETGMTAIGPHRDRFSFYIAEKDFSKMASTGQSRLITLAMRNAQAHFYLKKTGRKPVLLIDDVLLELDKNKRKRFISTLPEYEQAFFTYLPGEEIPVENGSELFFQVKNGEIIKQ